MSGFLWETLKPLRKHLTRKGVVEMVINAPGRVVFEDQHGAWKTVEDRALTLDTLHWMLNCLANYVGQRLDVDYPILSIALPVYGYRLQAVWKHAVEGKISLSIRMGQGREFSLEDYFGAEAPRVAALVEEGRTLVVSGGTSSGKTTCVNALLSAIPRELRVITLENMRELRVPHPNSVKLIAGESRDAEAIYKQLAGTIVRMRPDRIVIGELTIVLSKFFLRLANTGHAGTMTTIHAETAEGACEAIRRNMLLDGAADVGLVDYIANTVDCVVQMHRGAGRRITAKIFNMEVEDGRFVAHAF